MAFPLVVNARSGKVEVLTPFAAPLAVDRTMTRTTRFGVLFPHNRSVAIEAMSPPFQRPFAFDMQATFSHTFAGVGPGRYIPSFPQWDRKETSYPFAF